MKRILCIAGILWCSIASALAGGVVLEGQTLKSRILKSEMRYSVYLPEGYQDGTRRYPVLYLLHGLNGSYADWVQQGDVGRIADATIASGKAPAMIIIMPDAKNTWYMNDYTGNYRYEDYFFQEFIPHMDQIYRTRPVKKYRGISGLSMGGHGALLYALKHPDMFVRCYAMSAALFTNRSSAQTSFRDVKHRAFDVVFGWDSITGDQRITKHFLENTPINIVSNMPQEQTDKVQFFLDSGDDDALMNGNFAMIQLMKNRKMMVEFRMRDGGHFWKYWREALPESMQFVGERFMSNH